MPRIARLVGVVLLVALTGCNRDQDPTIGGDASSTLPGSSTGLTSSSAPPDSTSGGAPPLSTPAVQPRAHLTDVRVGGRQEGDRVVFQFDTVVPGYRIDYATRPVTEDGSGEEVQVKGAAILEVRLENSSGARLDGEEVVVTYNGPQRIRPKGASVVTEVVRVGDFEGVLTWVIGLSSRPASLTVDSLGGPSRLVIDLPSGG